MEENRAIPAARLDHTQPRSDTNLPFRILVVDDDEAVRHLNSEVLIHFGYRVNSAKDGAAAWDTLQFNNYDLLVTDNQMPRMTGVELLSKLKYAGMALPVIMATGTLPKAEFARRPWIQPSAVLLKPFTPEDLLRTVEAVLSASGSRGGQSQSGSTDSNPP